MKLTFGRLVPEEIKAIKGEPVRWWGARAIYNECRRGKIHLVHDRQSVECGEKDPKPLIEWLNTVGLKGLAALPAFKQLWENSPEVVEFKEGYFIIQCNASGGYLYLGAWQYYPTGCQYEMTRLPTEKLVVPVPGQKEWPKEGIRWSNATIPPPMIGDTITANANGEWHGVVVGYFIEHTFLGIEVECDQQPEWVVKQKRPHKRALLFGCDLRKVERVEAA